jgi:hypothetical protein
MESASIATPPAGAVPAGSGAGDKGLKTGAISFLSNIVIAVASTAPG